MSSCTDDGDDDDAEGHFKIDMVYEVKARIQGWLRELCIYGDWDEQRITLDGQNRNICTCNPRKCV